MGKPTGFLEIERHDRGYEKPEARLKTWTEFVKPLPAERTRAGRPRAAWIAAFRSVTTAVRSTTMIPDWNNLVYRDQWQRGARQPALHQQFPGVHRPHLPRAVRGVLHAEHRRQPGDHQDDRMRDRRSRLGGRLDRAAVPAAHRPARRVAVVGSGPAGLACAQQLARAGHAVTLFEKDDRIGGLLRYGIPDFKMEKHLIDRRIDADGGRGRELPHRRRSRRRRRRSTSCWPSSTPSCCPAGPSGRATWTCRGRDLDGIHFAMDFLTQQNKRDAGRRRGRAAPDGTISGQGQARRGDRRRRYRLGLHRHLDPPGRAPRSPSSRSCRSRRCKENKALTWPDWPTEAAHLARARGRLRRATGRC